MDNTEKTSLVDLLLRPELPNVMKDLPKKQVEVTRLSGLLGEPVILELHGLPYGRVQELKRSGDQQVQILLAGCDALRDQRLMARYEAPTMADAAKMMLLPGEIDELAGEVEKLCGYRIWTIREVKNA